QQPVAGCRIARRGAPDRVRRQGQLVVRLTFYEQPCMSHDWRQHWQQLDQLLRQFAVFWQPIPFHTPHPAWIEAAPALHAWVSTLTDQECLALQDQPERVFAAARAHLPQLDTVHALTRLPTHTPLDAHQLL